MTERYLEDFAVGQTFGSGRLCVERERIKTFAVEFDLQPFNGSPSCGAGFRRIFSRIPPGSLVAPWPVALQRCALARNLGQFP